MPLSAVMVLKLSGCRAISLMTLLLRDLVVRSFNLPIMTKPDLRSLRVTMQSFEARLTTVSIPQWPLYRLDSTLTGRSEI